MYSANKMRLEKKGSFWLEEGRYQTYRFHCTRGSLNIMTAAGTEAGGEDRDAGTTSVFASFHQELAALYFS